MTDYDWTVLTISLVVLYLTICGGEDSEELSLGVYAGTLLVLAIVVACTAMLLSHTQII